MTADTLTLADFLLARIAEDEAAARAAIDGELHRPGEWGWTSGGDVADHVGEPCVFNEGPWTCVAGCEARSGLHIARHDPARVLAECEAKRRIVEECEASASLAACQPRGSYDEGITTGLLAAMHALAAVYADHPDYRAEWAL